ncbi:hypothetical protein EYR38_001922 [Pleurotus pulmonarius]|nr:hypothetical protein EYR38_001922 [Pleurotus pulmonarius]
MSAHLIANPRASHALVDDRESALHVLLYICIRYLDHSEATSIGVRGLLAMFDDYLQADDNPYRQGTRGKRDVIRAGGPNISFQIKEMDALIQVLCNEFAARYEQIEPVLQFADNPQLAELFQSTNLRRHYQALDRDRRLDNISRQPDWLYSSLRSYSKLLPEPPTGKTDYVDNTKRLSRGEKRRADDLCDEADSSKLISTHDSMAGSIDADMDLAPPVETPPHKKQRSSRK